MHTAPDLPPDWAARPTAARRAALKAAGQLIRSLTHLSAQGQQVVQRLIDGRPFTEWEHFPDDDVRDNRHASQYYYHAHAGEHREFVEHGHLHLFVHADTLGLGRPPSTRSPAPAHLVAISMNAQGMPIGFFTVNRWVTKGPWLKAADCLRGLDQFQIGRRHGAPEVNAFLRALLTLYRVELAELVQARDAELIRRGAGRDRRHVFADPAIEVLSFQPIDLMRDIEALEACTA